MCVNVKTNPVLVLKGKELGVSKSEKHLGMQRTHKNNNVDTVLERIKSAHRATYSLMGAGMYGLNGAGPEVSLLDYKKYVLPILLYGLEALVLSSKETDSLKSSIENVSNICCVHCKPCSY